MVIRITGIEEIKEKSPEDYREGDTVTAACVEQNHSFETQLGAEVDSGAPPSPQSNLRIFKTTVDQCPRCHRSIKFITVSFDPVFRTQIIAREIMPTV